MTYEELIKDTLLADERYVVMTAENRGLIRGLPAIVGNRFIDTGITEQCMIGMAAGMALRGRVPICHALSTFLILRAYEFIRTDVGIANLPIKLSGSIPGFLSDGNGATHQALEDISLMRGIPGMQVFCPADNEDMMMMLPKIWASPHPSYVRVNVRPAAKGFKHADNFELGKAEVVSEGSDLTILTYGMLFEQCMDAKAILEAQHGLSVGFINVRSIKPLDDAAVLHAAKTSKRLVIVEDHFQTGGLYSVIGELFLKNKVMTDVQSIALNEKWFRPGLLSEVLSYEGFTAEQLVARILAN